MKKQVLIALCIVIQKKLKFFDRKNIKITKPEHAFKGYASTLNV